MSVVSPKRYWKDLMDVHNPGVLEVYLGTDQRCYSTRVARSAVAGRQEAIFYWMVATFGMVAWLSPLHHMEKAASCVAASKGKQNWTSYDVGMHCLDASCHLILHSEIDNINMTFCS